MISNINNYLLTKKIILKIGGENVAPVLIEDEIKDHLRFVSNIMVVGDQKKYLTCLLTLKQDIDEKGQPIPNKLLPEAIT